MRLRCLRDERDGRARGRRCERGGSRGCDAREGPQHHPWTPQHPPAEGGRKSEAALPAAVLASGVAHAAPRRGAGGGVSGAGREAATRGRDRGTTRGRRNTRQARAAERARRRRRPTRGAERAPRRRAGAGGQRTAMGRHARARITPVRPCRGREGPRALFLDAKSAYATQTVGRRPRGEHLGHQEFSGTLGVARRPRVDARSSDYNLGLESAIHEYGLPFRDTPRVFARLGLVPVAVPAAPPHARPCTARRDF